MHWDEKVPDQRNLPTADDEDQRAAKENGNRQAEEQAAIIFHHDAEPCQVADDGAADDAE